METAAVPNAPPAAPATGAQPTAAARAQIERLAHEFEAIFIAQMLHGMRQSMLSDGNEEQGLGAETMTETFDQEIGAAMSRSGGIGLAKILTKALSEPAGLGAAPSVDQVTPPAVAPDAVSPPSLPAVAPVAPQPSAPASVDPRPDAAVLPGPVTSAYGWRVDPFNGQVRFHAGTDVALAYGHSVQAMRGGTVVFAGEQGGYGTTVVVDDGSGLRARYAHLSGCDVKVGDRVDVGQVLGRSGNSGRSTGPHLHLELVRDGRPVDPASFIDEAGLKKSARLPIPQSDPTRSANEN